MVRVTVANSSAIRGVSLWRKRASLFGLGVGIEHYAFLVLYALALQQCVQTIGQPYAAAAAHAAVRKAALASATAAVMQAAGGDAATAAAAAALAPPPVVEEPDPWAEVAAVAVDAGAAAAWANDAVKFGAAADSAEDETPLPHKLLPAFWAMVLTAVVVLLHVLSQLAQHWSIRVRVSMRCRPAATLEAGTLLLVTPPEHQGKPELVPVGTFMRQDLSLGLYFMFQRQRYELESDGEGAWVAKQLPYPVSLPLSMYLKSGGLRAEDALELPGTLRSRFGSNEFNVPIPTLGQLYMEQLLGPVTQFQLFSALLWIMDEYWKYALFHVGMIFMFEGTTAFSRLRSLQTLRGMGHKTRMLYCLRGGAWTAVNSDALLPGDIISLTKTGADDDCMVPCDCLILTGAAVANEATLTGESVPQMKEAATADTLAAGDVELDMTGDQRIHLLFSGTTLMQHSGDRGEGSAAPTRPPAPDNGIVCFVLRTGFASSQGALMRMIEFSQEQVTGDSRETLVLLMILLVFALVSAGHVLRTGLAEGKRSQYELLLRCVFILTTVVPPELPMQTALAVNTSLMALHKAGVFCTEPYRIPLAGKVDSCLFDKTGTLTTDKLVAQGVVCFGENAEGGAAARPLKTVNDASLDLCLVLAGCHSLLEIDGKLLGDPIEVAALQAIDWAFTPATATAVPGSKRPAEERPWKTKPSVKILHRYHFSSALQRMSVLARVAGVPGGDGTWGLVKGSPEAIAKLLTTKPASYDVTYRSMAERGMRVLALAAKVMPPLAGGTWDSTPRESVESGLRFVGFVAFSCRVRNDTASVVRKLSAGATQVSMVTGDAALTALHVARDVYICRRDAAPETPLLLTETPADAASPLTWVSARLDALGKEVHRIPFSAAAIPELAKKHDLCVIGPSLRAAAASDARVWQHMECVRVFARMSPEDKESVLKALRANGRHTLMCGDGANDVGALKQAHVGLALLSGFGDANTKKAGPAELAAMAEAAEKSGDVDTARAARAAQKEKAEEAAKKVADLKAAQERWKMEVAATRAEMVEMQKKFLEEELKNFENAGALGPFKAMRVASSRLYAVSQQRNAERMARFGGSPFAMQAGNMASMMEGLEDGDLPRVKLGDASIAAPFTSKVPSISATVDIVRQGRCALVNTAQQQQILALNCLISAYSLSALYLDGIKSGEAQMIATGILLTVASLAFSFARPVPDLAPVAPLRSIFHPAYSLSLIGQLLIHLVCMVVAFNMAKQFEPDGPGSCSACAPAVSLSEGKGFIAELTRAVEKELAKQEAASDPATASTSSFKFTPSLLNTVVFLVTTAQQVSVMFVNYKGRPFMQGITENPAFMWSILLCCVGAFVCAFERMPELNAALKLVSMPNDDFRWRVLYLLAASTVGAFVWDRLCLAVFAPHVLHAALYSAQPDPWELLMTTKRTLLVVLTVLLVVGSGQNVIVLIAVYQAYRWGVYS